MPRAASRPASSPETPGQPTGSSSSTTWSATGAWVPCIPIGPATFTSHFQASSRRAQDLKEALTLIRRALQALDIALIRALSPQANRFLDEYFLPFWEQRFTLQPAYPVDAHRPLPEGTDLQRLFAEEERRVIGTDFTFRYKNCFYQIDEPEADAAMPKTKITIERRLDGSTHVRWRERYLKPMELGRTKPRPAPEPKAVRKPKPRPTPPAPHGQPSVDSATRAFGCRTRHARCGLCPGRTREALNKTGVVSWYETTGEL